MLNNEDTGHNFPENCGPWVGRIYTDNAMWSEYGAGFDLRTLPHAEYEAHMTLIAGRRWRENREAKKAEQKSRRMR